MSMNVGDFFEGSFEVANVVGSSSDGGSKAQFWSEHTGCDFYKQNCGILGCGQAAEVGGHMYVKSMRKFCFILPICKKCNKDPELDYPGFAPTKANVKVVARNMTDDMYE
jgi:hypothetical protein